MESISGIGAMQGMMSVGQMGEKRGGKALTDLQKTQIQEILVNYDSMNITETTAKEIFQKFSEAGIVPGRGMKETIEASGFDSEKLRDLGMPAGFKTPGGRQGGLQKPFAITDEQAATVTDILSKFDPSNLSSTDIGSILTAFRDASIVPVKGLREVVENAGFNPDSILGIPPSKSEDDFWASQNASQEINLSSLQSLQSILNQYDLSNITTEDETSLVKQLQATSLFKGSYINLSA